MNTGRAGLAVATPVVAGLGAWALLESHAWERGTSRRSRNPGNFSARGGRVGKSGCGHGGAQARRRRRHARTGRYDRARLGCIQRRRRALESADRRRRRCRRAERVRRVRAVRSRDHRRDTGHRRAAQGRCRCERGEPRGRDAVDGRGTHGQRRSGQVAPERGRRRQRDRAVGWSVGFDVGGGAEPARHGQVPDRQGRRL